MQKITFWACMYITLLMSINMSSQVYQPLQVQSGFTDDVIAEALPASNTTTKPVDTEAIGGNFAFMSTAYPEATNGLPANGLISSAVTTGLNFQLAPYSGNNSLRINTQNGQGTLVFQNLVKAKKVYVLATSGSAISTFTGIITFNDNTTQNITSQTVSDWYGGSNFAISGIGRVGRLTGTVENNSTNPRIYQLTINIDATNQLKQIKSIQFTKTSTTASFLNIFGVSVEVAEDCPSPETTTFTSVTSTGATATWTAPPLIPGQGYLYELRTSGAAGSGPAGLVLSETVTTLSKTFTNLPSSTTYSFYIKSVCSATESSSWRLGGTFTTLNAGQIGSGTGTSANLPINSNYGYNYSQQIYTKQQIEAVIVPGNNTITKVRFYYNGTSTGSSTTTTNFNNWTVYLGNTAKSAFASTTDWIPLTALQQTFDGVVTFPAAGNWMEITFTTPFTWNGTDNLVIAVKESVSSFGSAVYWRSFTSGDNTGIYYRNDTTNPNPATPPTATGRTNVINQIIIPQPCFGTPNAGVSLPAAQTLCNGANVSSLVVQNVNYSEGITYQWQESDDNGATDAWADVTTGTGATTLSYVPGTFTGTNKYYRLKTTCSASNQVAYSSVSSVLGYTNPNTATNLVFTSVNDFSMKIGWTNGNGTRRMVVISNTNSFVPPTDGSGASITANATYSGTGQQVIYDGTGNTVTVNGLNCSTTYYIHVYEYNRCGSSAPFTYWYALPLTGSQISTVTTLGTTPTNLGLTANFNTFNTAGDNLPTASPGWNERTGDGPFTANTSTWKGGTSLNNIRTARVNLYGNSRKEWIISPLVTLDVLARIKFKAAITGYDNVNTDPDGMQGTDDKVEVMISTDACGTVWTPLYTFNAANTATLTNILTDFEVVIPEQYVGQNVYIGFKASDGPIDNDPNDYDFHIANVVIEAAPTCADTSGLTSNNITKNSATISWTASTPEPASGYEYEIRTNGTPGSPGAIQTGTTAAGIITKDVTGLTPATTYQVYVRTFCDATTKGNWSLVHTFTTLCNYPDLLNTTGATICGLGTAQLTATATEGIIQWFSTATGGAPLYTGTTFSTPEINTTTTFYASAAQPVPNSNIQVGNGITPSTEAGQSPYYYNWGGYKHQYIYTAQELAAAGVLAGPINSVGFDVVTGSTANRNDFTIHIGTTTQNTATTTHVSGLTQVYSNAAQPMTVGLNTYPFTSPFVWDGTSNIVVQVNWSNNNGGDNSKSGSVRYHTTTNNQCTYTNADNRTAAQILQTMTGKVANATGTLSGDTTTSANRANTYFNGVGLCSSPRVPVVATVTAAPELVLNTTNIAICNGSSASVSIVNGVSNYDTYTVTPNTGVIGNETTGWTFNPTTSTIYTIKASQSSGSMCSKEIKVNVNVNALPTFTTVIDPIYTLCANAVQELKAEVPSEIIVGTATTLTGNWDAQTAFMNRFDYSKQQYIYSKVELNALGFSAGKITGMAFNVATLGSGATNANYTIKMKQVSNSIITSTDFISDALTTVYGPVTHTHTATGWQNINFTTPFVWDGSSNILIELRHEGANSSNNAQTYYTQTSENTGIAVQGYALNATSGDLTNKRLNIKFYLEPSAVSWSPAEHLYTDAAASIPYVAGNNATTVYFKSVTALQNAVYTATATNALNCSTTITTSITVNETPIPVISQTNYCKNSTLANITETLPANSVIKWYATATAGTELAPTTELVDNTTYYASQIVNGCESVNRTPVTVVVHNTTAPTTANSTQAFCIQANASLADVVVNGTAVKWYSAATEGTELPLTTSLVNGTTYYASQTVNACESLTRLAIQINLIETEAPTTTEAIQLFCTISNSTLADINVNGNEIKWYSTATGGTALPSTTLLEDETTYYASQTLNGCESIERLAVEVIVDDISAPTTTQSTQVFCIQTSPTLASLQVTGVALKWYDAAVEGIELPITTALINGTTYYASQTITGCESDDRLAVTVQIQNTTSPTTTNNNQSFCIQEQATIEDLVITGTNIRWYNSANATTQLAANTLLATGVYYATQVENGCESTQRLAINVTVTNVALPTTTSETQSFCLQNDPTVANLSVTGTGIKWYNASTGGNEILLSTPLVHNQIYYAVQTLNGCESATRLAVTALVFNTAVPTTQNATQVFCIQTNPTLQSIQITGTAIKWYSNQNSTTPLSNTTPLVNGSTYFATQTLNGCESEQRLAVTVQVQETPKPTTNNTNQSFCEAENATLQDLNVNGTAIKWYDSATTNTELAPDTLLTTGTYYAVQVLNGCESVERLLINVTVTNVATPTTSSTTQSFCAISNSTVANLSVNETGVKWYANALGGNELSLTTPLVHNQMYYAALNSNGCESAIRLEIIALVFNTQAPTTVNTSQSFCSFNNPKLSDIVLTGTNIKWYSTLTGNTILPTTTALVNGATYYASQTENGCESIDRLAITVTVGANPTITSSALTICSGVPLSDVVVDGLTFNQLKWYSNTTSTTPLSGNTVLSTGTYYVSTYTINLCESTRKPMQITVNTVPIPFSEAQTICGAGTVASLYVQGLANATFNWYNGAQSTTPLALTAPLVTGTYYVEQVVNGCKSAKKAVPVTVVSIAAPNVSPFILCEGSTVEDLVLPTGGGVTYFWYTSPSSTSVLQLNHVLTTGIYFVERISNGCISQRKMVNVTIIPAPASPTGNSNQTFVDSASIADLIVNEANVIWYNSLFDAENGVNSLAADYALINDQTYYAVLVSDAGCRSLPFAVNVIITVNTKEFDLANLKYYPNPVDTELNISYVKHIKNVELYTILGQRVLNKTFDSKDVKIDLSSLSSGTYIVRIMTDKESQFVKIIKN